MDVSSLLLKTVCNKVTLQSRDTYIEHDIELLNYIKRQLEEKITALSKKYAYISCGE